MAPVKQPRFTRRPEERPQELLDAAIRVFAARGYRAARLEEVAEAAGVTKGAIYHYFDTKEQLLRAAVESRISSALGGIDELAHREHRSATERLRAVLGAAWERWLHPDIGSMYRLITGELRREFPELFAASMRTGPMRLWALVAEVIRDGQRTGEFAADVDALAAATVLGSGLMHQAHMHRDLQAHGLAALTSAQLFEGALAMALQGLLPRAATGAPQVG